MDQTPLAPEENRTLENLPQIDQPQLTPVGDIDEDDAETAAAYQSLMRHREERRRAKIKRFAIVAGVIAAIVLFNVVRGLIASGGRGGSGENQVPTEFIYRDDFRESISGTGSAKPREQVTVAADLTGEVESIEVAVGDTVDKGAVLMTVRNDSLAKAADDAWYAYKEAELAEDDAQEALNAVWYDGTQEEKDRAYIALQKAKSATESALAAYEDAAEKARDCTVRAPIAGTVTSLGNATVGQPLGTPAEGQQPASSNTGIQIADLSQISIAVEVSEIDIPRIQVGQHATVTFSALPGVESSAVVTEIATLASGGGEGYYGGNVTYTVTLLIEEPDPQLKPGMSASVIIDVQYIPGALCVSTNALMTDDGETYYLMVLNPNTGEPEQRAVTVVAEGPAVAVIEGAVAEGDEVLSVVDWSPEGGENGDGSGAVLSIGY